MSEIITEQQFRQLLPSGGSRLAPHWPYVNSALELGKIVTPKRITSFFAQVGHESNDYLWMSELADGEAYEFRTDLGNTPEDDGDGPRFKGGGPMQVTGTDNYRACGEYLGVDLIANPEKIRLPQYATASAVWFWVMGNKKVNLNYLADLDWFRNQTRVINGGYNGLADRIQRWDRNRTMFGLPLVNTNDEASRISYWQATHAVTPVDGDAGPRTWAAVTREAKAREAA